MHYLLPCPLGRDFWLIMAKANNIVQHASERR
jgi:hypothetical protein